MKAGISAIRSITYAEVFTFMNILELLNKELSNGNEYFNESGESLNTKREKAKAKKEYLTLVKEDKIDIEMSLADFTSSYLSEFCETTLISNVVELLISSEKDGEELRYIVESFLLGKDITVAEEESEVE